jgi:ATP-dependent DNA helicase RecG
MRGAGGKTQKEERPMKPCTDEELAALLRDLESDRVERKQSFKGDAPTTVREAVCAFANDLPGHGSEPGRDHGLAL